MHEIKLSKVQGINNSNCNQRVACACGWKSIAATTETGAAETFQFHVANPSVYNQVIRQSDAIYGQKCEYCTRILDVWCWTSTEAFGIFTCPWEECRDKLAAEVGQ